MRKTLSSAAVLFAVTAVLAGCTGKQQGMSIKKHLENPLFAERFAESMVDRLVEIEILKDPIMEDSSRKAYVEEERKAWLEVARDAREKQRMGTAGNIVSINEYAKGDMLYVEDRLYFSTLFEVDPLPALHVYLTTIVDPRDVAFPDETALDLGGIQTPYGAQTYDVPAVDNPLLYRTVVLWDKELGRLHSFVQLSK